MLNDGETVVERVISTRLIAILRGFSSDQALEVGRALADGGAGVLEVSLVDPDALGSIRLLRQDLGERCLVGAGTVLSSADAEKALAAGAEFLFSPGLNRGVIEAAERRGALAIPGVFTATEVVGALELGTELVKLFPAEPLGPEYLRQLLGPLPELRAVPTGGISDINAPSYLRAGAVAVGAGSSIADPAWARAGEYGRYRDAAARFRGVLTDLEGDT